MPFTKLFCCSIYKAQNKDFPTILLTFIIFFSQIYSLIFIDVYLWIEISPAFLWVGFALTLLILYHLLICICSDPGALKTGSLELTEVEQQKQEEEAKNKVRIYTQRYCKTCKIMRPPKASHCHTCNHCVKGFDHHCFFVGNCIGIRNRGNFVWFLLLGSLQIIYRLVLSIITVFNIFGENKNLQDSYEEEINIFIGTFVLIGLSLVSIFICKRVAELFFTLNLGGIIFLIAGSIVAIKNVDGLEYYEFPIFSLLNIYFHFPFIFWLVPVTTQNLNNSCVDLTTKEKSNLSLVLAFNPNADYEKKDRSFSGKLGNLLKILFGKREKSELD